MHSIHSIAVDKLNYHDIVTKIESKPDKNEVGPVDFVVTFRFDLVVFVGGKSFLASRRGSVAPRYIVQVAHGVDLEDIGEHGHHDHIRDKADGVVLKVLHEIQRAHHHRQDVDSEHDHSSEAERAKVSIGLILPIAIRG